MSVYFTNEFIKNFKKLKGKEKEQVKSAVDEIMTDRDLGKPLRYSLKGLRSYRVGNMRIIYALDGEDIYFITFGKRKNIYENLKRRNLG